MSVTSFCCRSWAIRCCCCWSWPFFLRTWSSSSLIRRVSFLNSLSYFSSASIRSELSSSTFSLRFWTAPGRLKRFALTLQASAISSYSDLSGRRCRFFFSYHLTYLNCWKTLCSGSHASCCFWSAMARWVSACYFSCSSFRSCFFWRLFVDCSSWLFLFRSSARTTAIC